MIGQKWALPGTERMPELKEREGKKKVALHRIETGSTDTNGYRPNEGDKMAERDSYSGWSTEVSFMDWPMSCVLEPTGGR